MQLCILHLDFIESDFFNDLHLYSCVYIQSDSLVFKTIVLDP